MKKMAKLKSDIDYVQYALDIAYDDRYYYAHSSDPFAFSCSTLVGHSLFETGYVKTDPRPKDGHAIGGSVLDSYFKEAGFKRYLWANAGGLKPGDALIVEPYHVAWHVKDGIMVAANGNGDMVDRSPTAITTYDYRLVGTPKYVWRPTKIHKVNRMVTVKQVLDVMRSWLGLSRTAQTHRPIIDIYNGHRPLARGYAVTYWDDYCDATVSAAFIMLDAVSAIGGTECGVQEHIGIFKNAGIWKGRTKPKAGWIITYDWDGDGVADHIGIVEKISGNTVTAIEGNTNGGIVGRRTIAWNASTVLGYAAPKYSEEKEDTYMFECKNIKYGDTGNDVRRWQLLMRGYRIKGANKKDLTIDGSFGDNVLFATKAFQKAKGLPVTGEVKQADWKKALKCK